MSVNTFTLCLLAYAVDIQINEAFASQFAYCVDHLGISIDKINPKCVSNSRSFEPVTDKCSLQWWSYCHLSSLSNE